MVLLHLMLPHHQIHLQKLNVNLDVPCCDGIHFVVSVPSGVDNNIFINRRLH